MDGELTIPITLSDGLDVGDRDGHARRAAARPEPRMAFRVVQADGAGTMTVSPTWARNGSIGNTLAVRVTRLPPEGP